ncbi:MAG: hypothetical protein AB7E47_00030 [Desulfovibrionaceae bacterium]
MKPNKNSPFVRIAALYKRMGEAYATVAAPIAFGCDGCPNNCCVSYFQHHTYIEWAYLWQGMKTLPKARREAYLRRAEDYVRQSRAMVAEGLVPGIMCPLNDDGLCGLYSHRLMICRLHGTGHFVLRPSGDPAVYPGCFRYEERAKAAGHTRLLDRTPLYRELAGLEMAFVGKAMGRLPKVDLTLAEMLVQGPPRMS